MERINILQISTSLFLISYFFSVFIYKSSESVIRSKYFDIIPFVIIISISNLSIFVSDYYVFKVALFFLMVPQALFLLFRKNVEDNVIQVIAFIIAVLGLMIILLDITIPIFILNVTNILLSGIIVIIHFKNNSTYQSKLRKEISEAYLIFIIAIVMMNIGHSFLMVNFGIMVYVIFQLSEIGILVKHYRISRQSIDHRLEDLENKFERSVEFEAKKRTSVLVDKVEHIRVKSQKDTMTKALNRHGLTSVINDLINDNSVKIFSIAMFDIDNFKAINDTKGHMIGDECLKYLSYSFMINNRKTDFLGRYGGDEFILIMPHINAPGALEVCERMRVEIQNKSAPKFTISMGVATFPYDGKSFSTLLEIADRGLYDSKEAGRNQVKYAGNVFTKG